MKQIKESEKLTTIILEEGDILEICKRGKIKENVRVVCTSNTLKFDDITYNELVNLKEEKKLNKSDFKQ